MAAETTCGPAGRAWAAAGHPGLAAAVPPTPPLPLLTQPSGARASTAIHTCCLQAPPLPVVRTIGFGCRAGFWAKGFDGNPNLQAAMLAFNGAGFGITIAVQTLVMGCW